MKPSYRGMRTRITRNAWKFIHQGVRVLNAGTTSFVAKKPNLISLTKRGRGRTGLNRRKGPTEQSIVVRIGLKFESRTWFGPRWNVVCRFAGTIAKTPPSRRFRHSLISASFRPIRRSSRTTIINKILQCLEALWNLTMLKSLSCNQKDLHSLRCLHNAVSDTINWSFCVPPPNKHIVKIVHNNYENICLYCATHILCVCFDLDGIAMVNKLCKGRSV